MNNIKPQLIKSAKTTFPARKAERKTHYKKHVEKWRLNDCRSCNGTGDFHYDENTVLDCATCNGKRKEWYIPDYETLKPYIKKTYMTELSESVAVRIFVLDNRSVVYQYFGLDDGTKDPRFKTTLKYGYDDIDGEYGWYFRNRLGRKLYLHQFEVFDKQKERII